MDTAEPQPPLGRTTLITAAQVVTPDVVHEPGWVEVVGTRVNAVGAGPPPRAAGVTFPAGTLVPGFVDAHVHGGGGSDYGAGDPDSAAVAVRTHRAHGTTTTMASLVTASMDDLERAVRSLADLVDDGLIAGIHLEGPWLSPLHAGAHDRALLRTPDPPDVERLLAAGRGAVRIVTLAPELDGGIEAVRRVVGHGLVAAVGHTDATYEVTRAALRAGASAGTHLFNAMRALHQREPGPTLALLEEPSAWVELIADGLHLHPSLLRGVQAVAGPRRCVLVTDAMAAAGAADGDYLLGGLDVHVRHGEARLKSGALAGSTLTLDAALRYAVNVARVPLVDAVRAATSTPAAMLGLAGRGSIAAGHRADLVALDGRLQVTAVMAAGRWL